MKQVKFRQTMTPDKVKDAILCVFKNLHISSFIVLDTVDSGHTLAESDEQNMDGE